MFSISACISAGRTNIHKIRVFLHGARLQWPLKTIVKKEGAGALKIQPTRRAYAVSDDTAGLQHCRISRSISKPLKSVTEHPGMPEPTLSNTLARSAQ
jgi:hypothetical protein